MQTRTKGISFKTKTLSKSLSKQKFEPYLQKNSKIKQERRAKENIINNVVIRNQIKLRIETAGNSKKNQSKQKYQQPASSCPQHDYNLDFADQTIKNGCRHHYPRIKNQQDDYQIILQKIQEQNTLIKHQFKTLSMNQNYQSHVHLPEKDKSKEKSVKEFNQQTALDTLRLQYLKQISLKNEQIDELSSNIDRMSLEIQRLRAIIKQERKISQELSEQLKQMKANQLKPSETLDKSILAIINCQESSTQYQFFDEQAEKLKFQKMVEIVEDFKHQNSSLKQQIQCLKKIIDEKESELTEAHVAAFSLEEQIKQMDIKMRQESKQYLKPQNYPNKVRISIQNYENIDKALDESPILKNKGNENESQDSLIGHSIEIFKSQILTNNKCYFRASDNSRDIQENMKSKKSLKDSQKKKIRQSKLKKQSIRESKRFFTPTVNRRKNTNDIQHSAQLTLAKSYLRFKRRETAVLKKIQNLKSKKIIFAVKMNDYSVIRRSLSLKLKALKYEFHKFQSQMLQNYSHEVDQKEMRKILSEYPFFLNQKYSDQIIDYAYSLNSSVQQENETRQKLPLFHFINKLRQFIIDYEFQDEQDEIIMIQKLKKSLFDAISDVIQSMKKLQSSEGKISEKHFVDVLTDLKFTEREIDMLLCQCSLISADADNLAYDQYFNIFLLEN